MTAQTLISLDEYLGNRGFGRNRMIDVAAGLFRQRGFVSVSLMDVAQAVGLSKAGLYHYWPNKESLLQAIAHLSGELLLRQLREVREITADPEARMQAYMRTRLEVIARHQDLFTVTWQERTILSSSSFSELSKMAEQYRKGLRGLIDEAKQAGVIRQETDSHLLTLALDGIAGWAYFWYRKSGELQPEQIGNAFWDMLANGIVAPNRQKQ